MSFEQREKEDVSMVRADGKLGIQFASPDIKQKFLDFVIKNNDPYTEHYQKIIENDGLIPLEDPEFMAMLDRKGITPATIPNKMRADYMVAFKNK